MQTRQGSTSTDPQANQPARPRRLARRFPKLFLLLGILGPGLIAANAGNDAGGIATYAAAGARYGYQLLWVLVIILVALIVVQEMCARLGSVTGMGFSDLVRERFGVRMTTFVVVVPPAVTCTAVTRFTAKPMRVTITVYMPAGTLPMRYVPSSPLCPVATAVEPERTCTFAAATGFPVPSCDTRPVTVPDWAWAAPAAAKKLRIARSLLTKRVRIRVTPQKCLVCEGSLEQRPTQMT